jgi:peptide/nickel transport system ATP-binding protein
VAPILEVNDLQVHFPTERGPVKAVDGVSFALEPGERLGLIGESGSGKSTIALAIMRLIKPPGRIVGGEIFLDGDDLLELSDEEMRRRRLDSVAMVTQGAMNSLNPVIRIRPQLIDGMEAHGIKLTKREYDERIGELLDAVDLPHHVANLYPHQLSGGMKQRVCIATAISLKPKVIIADEPTSALDVVVQRHVMETLRKVQDRIGASVILIGHDMGLMAQFAQRVAVMRAGQILEINSVREIFASPKHPYTKLLMDSLPSIDRKESILSTLKLAQAVESLDGAKEAEPATVEMEP